MASSHAETEARRVGGGTGRRPRRDSFCCLKTLVLFAAAALCLAPEASQAQSLKEALAATYRHNPTLLAQERTVPAASAVVARALSGYLPRVNATSQLGLSHVTSSTPGTADQTVRTSPRGVGLDVSQTLFDGGRTGNTVRQARFQLSAAEAAYREAIQAILFDAISVYLDVLRDEAIVKLEKQNQSNLSEQLRLVSGLFEFGDVTQTDVLQVRARVAEAEARVAAAEAAAKASTANFRRIIGRDPSRLTWPRPADNLVPAQQDEAMRLAETTHPAILASLANANAAEAGIGVARSGYFPVVSLSGTLNRRIDDQATGDRETSATVVGRVTIPLFQGGETRARVSEATEVSSQRRFEADAARTRVQADIASAYAQYRAARSRIQSVQVQVQAATQALKGVREEFGLGQRTAANVLDAAQDLLLANINLMSAQRDRVLSSFAVRRALGQLSIDSTSNLADEHTGTVLRTFRDVTAPIRMPLQAWSWPLRRTSTSCNTCRSEVGEDGPVLRGGNTSAAAAALRGLSR